MTYYTTKEQAILDLIDPDKDLTTLKIISVLGDGNALKKLGIEDQEAVETLYNNL